MLKKCFIAAAILMANPAFASAQDIFWSFSPTELISSANLGVGITSGSAYIFSDGYFGFDSLDLNFTTSNSDAIRFTGGEAFNPIFSPIGGTRFDSSVITVDAGGGSGALHLVNVTQNGVNTALGPLFDPGFDDNVGPNGAVLLARVDFEVVGGGTADLEFALGPQGALELDKIVLDPQFGSATLAANVICVGEFNIGDVNSSGSIDFFDISPFIAVLASGGYQFEADCHFDGVVDFLDIAPFIEILTNN